MNRTFFGIIPEAGTNIRGHFSKRTVVMISQHQFISISRIDQLRFHLITGGQLHGNTFLRLLQRRLAGLIQLDMKGRSVFMGKSCFPGRPAAAGQSQTQHQSHRSCRKMRSRELFLMHICILLSYKTLIFSFYHAYTDLSMIYAKFSHKRKGGTVCSRSPSYTQSRGRTFEPCGG